MNRESILASFADPNRAWTIIPVGIVLIYRELARPGGILPGLFGALAVCVGVYSLGQHPWSISAAGMILTGVAPIVVQGFWRLYWIPCIVAAALIPLGAHGLTEPPIHWAPALAAVPLAAVTAVLLRTAIMARRKKVSLE